MFVHRQQGIHTIYSICFEYNLFSWKSKRVDRPQNVRKIFMKILDPIIFVILFKTKIFSFFIEYFLYILAKLFFLLIKIYTSFK